MDRYIHPQVQIAQKLKIPFKAITTSPLKSKKYRIYLNDGSHVDYGSAGMSDYLIHQDKKRRARFHQRFQGNKGYNDSKSGLYYSKLLLW
jgi:ribosomal protein L31